MPTHRNDWRRTMVLFALTGLVESLAFGHLSAFTPIYLRELRVPEYGIAHWTGVLSALSFVIGLPLLPFWGVWADRYGRKLVIIRSSVVAAAVFALTAASTDVYMLAFGRLLSGFVFGNTGIMMAMQADITPRDRLGTTIAIVSAGSPVGMAVGPYLGGLAVERWGIRGLLYFDAALTMVLVLALIAFLREEPRRAPAPASLKEGVTDALRGIFLTPHVPALFLSIFLFALGNSAAGPYAPLLVEKLYRGPDLARVVGEVLTAFGITMAVFTPLWGPIGDRRGHLNVFRVCAAVGAVCLGGQAAAATLAALTVFRAIHGAFQGGLSAMSTVLLASYTPVARRASLLNLSLLPQQIAWFLGPLLGAGLAQFSIAAPFWAAAAAMTLGLLLAARLPRPGPDLSDTVS